ncbi:hypothetical protein [Methylopila sp. M107]|uniref:hypothetical protein n=1 Tax=Methylopila sp. M107 TaxID=1101190 RepID=UPI00036D0C68|nr:hypothetical protein [Methylopila sp. M107]
MSADAESLALRRYVRERAAGRAAAEWSRYDPTIGAWLAADEVGAADAKGLGLPWRRVRQAGAPWCQVLGADVSVARDDELQAHLATFDVDDLPAWRRAWKGCARHPRQSLAEWRASGARLLAAATGGPVTAGPLAALFQRRGTGRRSLLGL